MLRPLDYLLAQLYVFSDGRGDALCIGLSYQPIYTGIIRLKLLLLTLVSVLTDGYLTQSDVTLKDSLCLDLGVIAYTSELQWT